MKRILIIGNGFDLCLGLKTSYRDFLGSTAFKLLIGNDNMLAAYLEYKNQIQNWVDVEHELKNYANGVAGLSNDFNNYLLYKQKTSHSPIYHHHKNDKRTPLEQLLSNRKDALKQEFVKLKQALHDYLSTGFNFITPAGAGESNAVRLLRFGTLFDTERGYHNFNFPGSIEQKVFDEIFTFNYTNPLKKLGYTSHERGLEPYFIHGSLNQNNIVFGVEDGSVPDEFNFLLKSDHAAFGLAPDLLLTISNEAREFHFFGCSLGDTDNAHFVDLFSTLAKNRDVMNEVTPKHKLFFYVYGKSGYQHIRNRILHLTSGQLARFRLNHDVVFYDIHSNQIVNQDYLNQL